MAVAPFVGESHHRMVCDDRHWPSSPTGKLDAFLT